jgi:hypothetical protein
MSFLCWISTGIFPSSPCKVVLDRPGRRKRDGFCAHVCVSWKHLCNRRFRVGPYVLASLIRVTHGRGQHEFQMFVDGVFCQTGQGY